MPFGAWQKGKVNQPGSIQHFSSVVQKLKKQHQDKKAMPRIRAADAEVNEILRTRHNRVAVEEKRASKKPSKKKAAEEEDPWLSEYEDDDDDASHA